MNKKKLKRWVEKSHKRAEKAWNQGSTAEAEIYRAEGKAFEKVLKEEERENER